MVMSFLRRLLGQSGVSEPAGDLGGEPPNPVGVTYPIDLPSETGDGTPAGPGGPESIGLLRPADETAGGGIWTPDPTGDVGVTYPIDRPTEGGDDDMAGSFFDQPGGPSDLGGIREPAIDPGSGSVPGDLGGDDIGPRPDLGDVGAVSIGPKHEDPSPPPPEGMSSTVGGPGGGPGGDVGAVSIGPKHEDPSPPPPDGMSSTVGGPGGGPGDGPGGDIGAVSIGPKHEDPSPPPPEGMSSTVGAPGGGPGDGPGGDVGADSEDDGPSTLMDSDGGGINLQGDQAPDLGDLAEGTGLDLEGTLEP